nr:immunoglobulin heavy chain junction region [Mus musculus]
CTREDYYSNPYYAMDYW